MGIVHPAGAETCSPGIFFFYFYVLRAILVHFGSTNSAYPTFDMLGTNSTGLQG